MSSTGIYQRHLKTCPQTGACKCRWSMRVYNRHTGKRVNKGGFKTEREAIRFKREVETAIDKGQLRAATKRTVREACDEFIAGIQSGEILSVSGTRYRPTTIDSYERHIRLRVKPKLGTRRLADIDRPAMQRFVDEMVKDGDGAETVHHTLAAISRIYQRAIRRGEFHAEDPTRGLELPRTDRKGSRVASPSEAAQLIAAAPECDRGIWACAFYAGLRLGEIQALTWDRIDTSGPVALIEVDRSWTYISSRRTRVSDFGPTKTPSGRRFVPVIDELVPFLRRQWDRTGGQGFVFPWETTQPMTLQAVPDDRLLEMHRELGTARTANQLGAPWSVVANRVHMAKNGGGKFRMKTGETFNRNSVRKRAYKAWEQAGLRPIKPHDCRKTFISIMMGYGVDSAYVQYWAGHKKLSMTQDVYTRRVPGNEAAAIARANEAFARGNVRQLPPAADVA